MTSISVPTPGRRDWANSTHPAGRRGVVPVVLFFFVLWTNLAVVLTQVHGVPQFIGSSVVVLLLIPIVRALIVDRQAPVVTPVLPLVLIFMTLLVNKHYLMKEWTNSPVYNFVSWTAVAIMIGLTVALVGISVRDLSR